MRWPPRRWFVGTVRDALVLGVLFVTVACTTSVPGTDQPVSPPPDVDVGLTARIHINTQTTDFARARAFYRMLGFTTGVGGFPKTNTHLMARSLGMYDLCTYELQDIEVIAIPGSWGHRVSTSFSSRSHSLPPHHMRRPPIWAWRMRRC